VGAAPSLPILEGRSAAEAVLVCLIAVLHFFMLCKIHFKLLLNISHQQFVLMPGLQILILKAKVLGFLK